MEQTATQPKTDAEHLSAIEEMEQQIKTGFERIEATQKHTRERQERVDRMLDQLEARR